MLCMTASRACATDAVYLIIIYNEYTQSRQSICENSVFVTYTANYLIKYQYKTHQGRPGKN